MFLIFDNLFSLLLGYYWLGLWLLLAWKRLNKIEELKMWEHTFSALNVKQERISSVAWVSEVYEYN